MERVEVYYYYGCLLFREFREFRIQCMHVRSRAMFVTNRGFEQDRRSWSHFGGDRGFGPMKSFSHAAKLVESDQNVL